MDTQKEGILPAQIDAIKSLAKSIERNGARASCVIAFGSRAREEGRPGSDLDAFFLLDFDEGDPSLLSDESLRRTKYIGQATTEKSGPAGDIHLFLYNKQGFVDRLIGYPDLNSSHLFTGMANDGVIIQGEEPLVGEEPLREYLRKRLKR